MVELIGRCDAMQTSMVPTKTIAVEFAFRDCIECNDVNVREGAALSPAIQVRLAIGLGMRSSSKCLSRFVPDCISLATAYPLAVGDQVKVKMAWDNTLFHGRERSEVVAAISTVVDDLISSTELEPFKIGDISLQWNRNDSYQRANQLFDYLNLLSGNVALREAFRTYLGRNQTLKYLIAEPVQVQAEVKTAASVIPLPVMKMYGRQELLGAYVEAICTRSVPRAVCLAAIGGMGKTTLYVR